MLWVGGMHRVCPLLALWKDKQGCLIPCPEALALTYVYWVDDLVLLPVFQNMLLPGMVQSRRMFHRVSRGLSAVGLRLGARALTELSKD